MFDLSHLTGGQQAGLCLTLVILAMWAGLEVDLWIRTRKGKGKR